MKKLLPMILCAALLFSLAAVPVSAAPENYCDLFSSAINLLRWWAPYNGVAPGEAFDSGIVVRYTAFRMCTDEYGDKLITEGEYSYYGTYAIPADVFESAARDFFANVNVDEMRAYTGWFWDYDTQTGTDEFQFYQPDRDVYLFGFPGGWGDSSHYDVLGYTEDNGIYTVYSRLVDICGEERPDDFTEEKYVLWNDCYWEIDHYLKTEMSVSNGQAQFRSWQIIDTVPDLELTKPLQTVTADEDITVEAEKDVFPEDTEVKVQTPEGATLKLVTDALETLAEKFVAYDITATHQPNGTVYVTFAIPEGYDPQSLAVFYIPADGSAAYPLDIQVDAESGTVTAELTHFSLYALAQLKEEAAPSEPAGGSADGDTDAKPDLKLPIIAAVCLAVLAVVAVVLVRKRKK